MKMLDKVVSYLLSLGIRLVVSEIVWLEFSSKFYDWGNIWITTPIKTIPPYSTELNRGGFLSFQVKITSNQLWNTNYSEYQAYLHNRITTLKQEGLGYRKIAKLLNSEGIKTPRNKEFLPASVHSILKKKKIRDTRINKEFDKEVSALELQYIDP